MNGSRARLAAALFTLALTALFLLTPRTAHAQRTLLTPTGGKGTLAIDNISGLRISPLAGVSYAGPLGVSTIRYSTDSLALNTPNQVFHYTTVWIAPAADYFVIDHLSIGGMVELASTSGSVDTQVVNGAGGVNSINTDLPTTTNLTLLPRIGYLIPIGDRFGIWPRGGIGYASRQVAGNGAGNPKDTFSALILDVNVDFLFRINETFFIVGAPELGLSLGGSHSSQNGAVSRSANANFTQFSVLTGLGIFWDL